MNQPHIQPVIYSTTTHFILYLYTFPSHIRLALCDGIIKCKNGDTHRGINDGLTPVQAARARIIEQQGTSNAEPYVLIGAWHIKKIPGFERDYDLHKLLKRDGRHVTDAAGNEWFKFDYPIGVEWDEGGKDSVIQQIEDYIKTLTGKQPRRPLYLKGAQRKRLDLILKARKISTSSKFVMLAYLCPRFGKTIWAIEVYRQLVTECGVKVMFLPAFVLSAHTSFRKELTRYEEFHNMLFIDTKDTNWERDLKNAMSEGKLPVVSVSLHASDLNQFKVLRDLDDSQKFIFVDEADFGAWTDKSGLVSSFLLNETSGIPTIVNASGTNIHRMALGLRHEQDVHFIQCAYCELEKDEPGTIKRNFFELSIEDFLATAIDAGEGYSWARQSANVDVYAHFWKALFMGLVGDDPDDNLRHLQLSRILTKANGSGQAGGIMCFLSMQNEELNKLGAYLRLWINDYGVVVLNGDAENHLSTTNENAEDIVRVAIREAKRTNKKGVIVLTSQMGSRSFSVPEIEISIIMRDRGSVSSYTQAGLRSATPGSLFNGQPKERCTILSLSIDSNRSDVMEMLSVEAQAVMSNNPSMTLPDALREYVLESVNIFKKAGAGYIQRAKEEMLKELQDNEVVLRVANGLTDVEAILASPEILSILGAVRVIDEKGNDKKDTLLKKVKTYAIDLSKQKNVKPSEEEKNLTKAIQEALRMLNSTATSVMYLAENNGGTYRQALEKITARVELQSEFVADFGVQPKDVVTLLDAGYLRESLLDLVVYNTSHDLQMRREIWV